MKSKVKSLTCSKFVSRTENCCCRSPYTEGGEFEREERDDWGFPLLLLELGWLDTESESLLPESPPLAAFCEWKKHTIWKLIVRILTRSCDSINYLIFAISAFRVGIRIRTTVTCILLIAQFERMTITVQLAGRCLSRCIYRSGRFLKCYNSWLNIQKKNKFQLVKPNGCSKQILIYFFKNTRTKDRLIFFVFYPQMFNISDRISTWVIILQK